MDLKISSSDYKNFEVISQIKKDISLDKKNKVLFNQQLKAAKENASNQDSKSVLKSDDIREMVDNINNYINSINRKIKFKMMRNFDNETVIQVVDMDKDEVIRQIPPDYLLKLEKTLAELSGLFTDETA